MAFLEHFRDKFAVAFGGRELSTYLGVAVFPPLLELFRSTYGLHGAYILLGAVSSHCIVSGVLLKPATGKTCVTTKSKLKLQEKPCFGHLMSTVRGDLNELEAKHTQRIFRTGLLSILMRILKVFNLSPALKHSTFALFLILHSFFYYTFTAWALYLVPFGLSLGFVPAAVVYWSTAGGVGGFLGKTLALIVFRADKMNAITGGLIPAGIICIGLTGFIFTENYLILLSSSFLCGFAIAYSDSAQGGLLPRYVCESHVRQGTVLNYLFGGICMQLGGSVSGMVIIIALKKWRRKVRGKVKRDHSQGVQGQIWHPGKYGIKVVYLTSI